MNTDERGFFVSLTGHERALLGELGLGGIRATAQASFAVTDKGHYVGD